MHQRHGGHAAGGEEPHALVVGGEQGGRRGGVYHLSRVAVEGDHHGPQGAPVGLLQQAVQ